MIDLNNRYGGPNLIVTAKTAHKVHFVDAATLAVTATIDMPGSTDEIALARGARVRAGKRTRDPLVPDRGGLRVQRRLSLTPSDPGVRRPAEDRGEFRRRI